jgi:hypothetical protein
MAKDHFVFRLDLLSLEISKMDNFEKEVKLSLGMEMFLKVSLMIMILADKERLCINSGNVYDGYFDSTTKDGFGIYCKYYIDTYKTNC